MTYQECTQLEGDIVTLSNLIDILGEEVTDAPYQIETYGCVSNQADNANFFIEVVEYKDCWYSSSKLGLDSLLKITAVESI
jgi:hypothetical protein